MKVAVAQWVPRLEEALESLNFAAQVYLYGSHARGTARADSDRDFVDLWDANALRGLRV